MSYTTYADPSTLNTYSVETAFLPILTFFSFSSPDSFELSHPQLVPDSRSSRSGRQLRQGELRREGEPQQDPLDPRRTDEKQPRRMDPMGGRSSRKHAAKVMKR